MQVAYRQGSRLAAPLRRRVAGVVDADIGGREAVAWTRKLRLFRQLATVPGERFDVAATLLVVCIVFPPQPASADTATMHPIRHTGPLPTLRSDASESTMLGNDDGGGGAAMPSFESLTVRTAVRLAKPS